MPSRKRNKGKDRKAKKAAVEAERIDRERGIVRKKWQGWARGEGIQCNHGVELMIPEDNNHPVVSFIDAFFLYEANSRDIYAEQYLRDTFTTHREVWDNERYREMSINIFVAIGTNVLLDTDAISFSGPKVLATAIVILENYDGIDIITSINSRVTAAKIRDISGSSNLRDALKFYRKRVICKCLKDMHLEARKTQPKTGMCYHCNETKERALLMVCSRCRITHYCSRSCQCADWPEHSRDCTVLCFTEAAKAYKNDETNCKSGQYKMSREN